MEHEKFPVSDSVRVLNWGDVFMPQNQKTISFYWGVFLKNPLIRCRGGSRGVGFFMILKQQVLTKRNMFALKTQKILLMWAVHSLGPLSTGF